MAPRPDLSVAPRRWVALAALVALVLAEAACATDQLSRAPARPDEPWTVSSDSSEVKALNEGASAATAPPGPVAGAANDAAKNDAAKNDAAPENRFAIEVGRRYTLPELIDIAERHNPETREAWEKARQAALAVGIAESSYLPQISAKVIGGYQRTPIPMPQTVVPAGFVTFISGEVIPTLVAKWLLFDFGQREAEVEAAKAQSFTANVTFTGAHEKIIYAVTKSYFALGAARASLHAAADAEVNAQRTQEISEARKASGLATVVDVAQTQRQTAQAHLDVVKAEGSERAAESALVASMGVDLGAPLAVADSSDRPLPTAPMEGVRALIERALVSRPDVIAALGKVHAAEANARKAHRAHGPTLGLDASIYENFGWWSVEGSPFFTLREPGVNVLLGLNLPLFDGGALSAKAAIARSELAEARAALDSARTQATADVISAYDGLQTSIAEFQAAGIVDADARTALNAAVEAYRSGVGPLLDALSAQTAAREAQLEVESARAGVFTSAAGLAFAVGNAIR
jgi:outer membrane protein